TTKRHLSLLLKCLETVASFPDVQDVVRFQREELIRTFDHSSLDEGRLNAPSESWHRCIVKCPHLTFSVPNGPFEHGRMLFQSLGIHSISRSAVSSYQFERRYLKNSLDRRNRLARFHKSMIVAKRQFQGALVRHRSPVANTVHALLCSNRVTNKRCSCIIPPNNFNTNGIVMSMNRWIRFNEGYSNSFDTFKRR